MEKRADSGVLSILAAIVSPIAAALVKHLLSRRRRAPINMEEHSMCRNHSHLTGVLIEAWSTQDAAGAEILVTQDLTLELLNGEKLTVPQYSVCLVLRDAATQSAGSQLHATAEQGGAVLSKVGNLFMSGHIIPPK